MMKSKRPTNKLNKKSMIRSWKILKISESVLKKRKRNKPFKTKRTQKQSPTKTENQKIEQEEKGTLEKNTQEKKTVGGETSMVEESDTLQEIHMKDMK